jgi:hypothetical protein
MALRDIEPFLNLSHQYSATIGQGYTAVLSGWNIPYLVYGGDTNSYARVTSLDLIDGWLVLSSIGSVSGNRCMAVGRPLQSAGINVDDNTVAFGGARLKFARSIPRTVMTIQGAAAVEVIASTAIAGNFQLNTEYYVEWCIDMANSLFRARVDGVEVAAVALSAAVKNALKAGTNYLMWGTYNSGSSSALELWLKDGYVLEKTPDGQMSGWLGPQTVKVLPVSEFNGPWAASSGTPKDVLNTPTTSAADRLTPLVTTDVNASEAILKFDASQVTGFIKGISLNVAMQKAPGKLGNLESSITSAGVESSKSSATAANAMAMYTRQLLSSKAPNGGAWTIESLAAATVKLKPVNS